LPEPRFEFQEPTLFNIATTTSALRPRIFNRGYCGLFSTRFGLGKRGWGRRTKGLASRTCGLLDWLVEASTYCCEIYEDFTNTRIGFLKSK
jgi:hypothetical protein